MQTPAFSLTFNPFGSVTVPYHNDIGTTQATVIFTKLMDEVVVQIKSGIPSVNGIPIHRITEVLGHEVVYHACSAQGGYKYETPKQTPIKKEVPPAPVKPKPVPRTHASPTFKLSYKHKWYNHTVKCENNDCTSGAPAVYGPACGHFRGTICATCREQEGPGPCAILCDLCQDQRFIYHKVDIVNNLFNDKY